MPITYIQNRSADSWRFPASHWVVAEVASRNYLVTLTGVVLVDFKGTAQSRDDWRRDRLTIRLNFPRYFHPDDKSFQVEEWAPFMTINAILNQGQAINTGWAVDAFGGPEKVILFGGVNIWADLAIQDIDSSLLRVGYSLTLRGRVVDSPPGPI